MSVKFVYSICLFFLVANTSYLSAQSSTKTQGLKKLSQSSELWYSNGYEIRASAIQDFLSEAIAFYKFEFPETAEGIEIMILDKNDWTQRYSEIPYGIPFFDAEKSIVIPADKFTASSELGYEDLSTDQEISEYDKFIISILGQSYILKSRGLDISEIWMRDVISNYFAVSFFEVNDFLWDLSFGQSKVISPGSLEVYNRLHKELPADRFYGYQIKFIELSATLFNKGGFQMLTELLDHFQQKGSVDQAETIISKYGGEEYDIWKASMK